jgi:hypothetical protein
MRVKQVACGGVSLVCRLLVLLALMWVAYLLALLWSVYSSLTYINREHREARGVAGAMARPKQQVPEGDVGTRGEARLGNREPAH